MNKIVHYLGLDVHKESIAVSIAPQHSTEVRRYGIIGGTLAQAHSLSGGARFHRALLADNRRREQSEPLGLSWPERFS